MYLSTQLAGKQLIITNIKITDPMIRHRIDNIGLIKNAKIQVLNYNKNKFLLHVLVNGMEYVLRNTDCQQIEVDEYKEAR